MSPVGQIEQAPAPRMRVTGSFPFYFMRTYPCPARRRVVVGLLVMSALGALAAAVSTYRTVPQSTRTQGSQTVAATVTDRQIDTHYSYGSPVGYETHLSVETARGPAKLDLNVKAEVPADRRIGLKQDPQDPRFVELPGYPQNTPGTAESLALFAVGMLIFARWFARRETRLIVGGEPVRRHAVVTGLLLLVLVGGGAQAGDSDAQPYPEGLSLAGP